MQTAIAVIFVLSLVIIFHEFGHFSVAKLAGITVHEFSIGMGPRLFKVKKNETEYSLRILPIGGYVKMEGEDEVSDDEGSFSKKPVLSRMAVVLAGAIMNFILAIIVFGILAFIVGSPTTTIGDLNKDLPAYEAGIRPGDKVVSINNNKISNWDELVYQINSSENSNMKVTIKRGDKTLNFPVKAVKDKESGRYIIGIQPEYEKSLGQSIKSGFQKTIFFLKMMFSFIGMLFAGKVGSEQVAGPVGMIGLIGEAAQMGFTPLLALTGFISINLGFFNLLPIPALDGSRFVFLVIELFRGKPIDPEKEGFIHFVGFVLLITLMIFVTYKDILKLDLF